ncbi:hypothetical protein BHE74_00023503 [Ensete ventricosum]|nr:hypothetical protein BHE74_00023503 [Ensete ventricosum]
MAYVKATGAAGSKRRVCRPQPSPKGRLPTACPQGAAASDQLVAACPQGAGANRGDGVCCKGSYRPQGAATTSVGAVATT